MVATRNHPQPFEEAVMESPTKRTTRSSTGANSTSSKPASPIATTHSRTRNSSTRSVWSHTPSNLTLLWFAVSLPLVVWDTGYVLLRPYSMPGGFLHAPIWSPYELYGRIDYVYGKVAWDEHNGWTAAQGSVNLLETAIYFVYLYIVYMYGESEGSQGRGAPDKSSLGFLQKLGESRTVHGKLAAWATVLCYSSLLVTFWKTVLYWLIEAYSGFSAIGHNDAYTLIFLWVLPNGLWLVFPAYLIYVFGAEIIEGLEIASQGSKKSQ